MTPRAAIPVTVIGGYLGAGKTTLLNEILADPRGRNYGVVVNDIGQINIDAALVASQDGEMMTLDNGCVCCSLVDGFAEVLQQLAEPQRGIDQILVEVSGVGDPWKVAQWGRTPGFVLDAVVTLADITTLQALAADTYVGDTIRTQLRGADVVVLTKVDLAPHLEREVRAWAQGQTNAPVLTSDMGVRAIMELLSNIDPQAQGATEHPPHLHHHVTQLEPAMLSRQEWKAWLQVAPPLVMRVKGFVPAPDSGQLLLQLVGKRSEVTRWKGAPTPNALVVIALEPPDTKGQAWLNAAR